MAAAAAAAQCTPGWQPGTASTDLPASVRHLYVFDADGAGGADGMLMAGGDFLNVGPGAASHIVAWNGSDWVGLGSGTNGPVYWMTAHEGGLVVCGTSFTMAGDVPASRIAKWIPDMAAWTDQGNFTNAGVALLSVASGGPGKLYATGSFTQIGGVPDIRRIGQYDGAAWSPLGNGASSIVSASIIMPNGDLVIGGSFTDVGELLGVNRVARWDGAQWHALGTGMSGLVRCFLVMSNGDLIVGGAFVTAGDQTVNNIARWDGAQWHAIGGGTNSDVFALAEMPDGDLVAAGSFAMAGTTAVNNIARWDGTEWTAMGSGVDVAGMATVIRTMAVLPNGELASGGDFTSVGGQPAQRFARWMDSCGGGGFCDADWCEDGEVGVPDIFCFLSDWFAMDAEARNFGGTEGVPAIFAFLSEWFGTGQGPCTP